MPQASTKPEMINHITELLAPLGAVRVKRMFGGYGIYLDELFIAIMALDQIYLKCDDETRPSFEKAGCKPFVYEGHGKPVTMSYWTPPHDALESPADMRPWAQAALSAALRARQGRQVAKPKKKAAP